MPLPPAKPLVGAAADALPAPLAAAVQRVQRAVREASERTVESLGLAALSASHALQRDALLTAQYELNRKLALFHATFDQSFDERVQREVMPRPAGTVVAPAGAAASPGRDRWRSTDTAFGAWPSLHLVEDSEVEAQISAERFAMGIAHACEWELREIGAYLGALLPRATDAETVTADPLRPEIVGHAMIRGACAVCEREDARKLLVAEMGRSLAPLLRACYAAIVGDWRQAGLRPAGLSVRRTPGSDAAGRTFTGGDDPATLARRGGAPSLGGALHSVHGGLSGIAGGGFGASHGGSLSGHTGFGITGAAALGPVEPALASVIRRLALRRPSAGVGGEDGWSRSGAAGASAPGGLPSGSPPPNLIQAHREELRQATQGAMDHLVIDVIGFLFDQILSDPKVAPQMARLLARLQLPVLRAALGDPSFFSSRRHPVRRFVNRVASLGAAFDDFGDPAAQAFLERVRALVEDVVDGDFEQIDLYEQQLAALEAAVVEHGQAELRAAGTDATTVLARKEDEQRLHMLYAERLAGELKDVAAPVFLRNFVARVWSQALLRAAERDGGHGELSARLRQAGRDVLLSVQPKGSPAQRKAFLDALPRLMQDLTEGMDLAGWPAAERHAFFGELMPAHAEALRATAPARPLDVNLMARHVDGALARPLPSAEEARRTARLLPVLTDALPDASFTRDEAQRVGLVAETAVDWDGQLDIDLDQVAAEAAVGSTDAVVLPGLPEMPTVGELPSSPRQLASQLQVGFAYQMHLEGAWHKVRLAHISEGRSFCIFTRGTRHRQTLSLTHRMLLRLCESGRLRPIEKQSLIERATARARRQLAQLGAGGAAVAGAGVRG